MGATGFRVVTQGQTLVVNSLLFGGSAVPFYTDPALTTAVTVPYLLPADTTFYLNDGWATDLTLSISQGDGTLFDPINLRPQVNSQLIVSPTSTTGQDRADASQRRDFSSSLRIPRPRPNMTMITTFQSGHGWTVNVAGGGTTNANDTTDFVLGSQCISGITPATAGAWTAFKVGMTAMDLSNKMIGVLVKMDRPDLTNSITLRLGNSVLTAYDTVSVMNGALGTPSTSLLPNQWAWVYTSYANTSGAAVGSPTRTAITDVMIRTDTVGSGSVGIHVGAIGFFTPPPAFPHGVVTFSFDDTYTSQYTFGKAKLDTYGYPAVAYTIVDRVGAGGGITLAQLGELQEAHGWDIAGHALTTTNHAAGFANLSTADLTTEVQGLRSWLSLNNFTGGDHFAWPLGLDSVASQAIVGTNFFTARGTVGTPFGSLPPDQRLRMRCAAIAASVGVATITGYIDKAYTYGLWMHLICHDILTSGASGSTQVLQSDFNTIVDYVNAKPIPVMTVSEVYRNLQAHPAT